MLHRDDVVELDVERLAALHAASAVALEDEPAHLARDALPAWKRALLVLGDHRVRTRRRRRFARSSRSCSSAATSRGSRSSSVQ